MNRVAANVCELADRLGHREGDRLVVRHGLTQQDIAGLAGISRREVTRILSYFRKRDWLYTSPGFFHLRDEASLRRLAAVTSAG
jgi:CRP-like cAMP-binding protein